MTKIKCIEKKEELNFVHQNKSHIRNRKCYWKQKVGDQMCSLDSVQCYMAREETLSSGSPPGRGKFMT